jgi:hypothetical protein
VLLRPAGLSGEQSQKMKSAPLGGQRTLRSREAWGPFFLADDVGFAAGGFHSLQRAERARVAVEPGPHIFPGDPGVPVPVRLEADLQRLEQRFAFLGFHAHLHGRWLVDETSTDRSRSM